MKKSIEILIGELESKLGGYCGLLYYRYTNLCVKAEPMALLSIVVRDKDGIEQNLEQMASVMMFDDYTFEVVPQDMPMMPNICAGFAQTHPEFKQEIVVPDDSRRFYRNGDNVDESERHLLLHMPDVDKARYDVLTTGVKTLYAQCREQIEKTKTEFSAKLTERTAELPADEAQEAKDKFEKAIEDSSKICDGYRDEKLKEIEDAYQQWTTRQTQQEQLSQQAAHEEEVTKSMKMPDMP